MHLNAILEKLRAFASKAKGEIVQECPPELYACEVCGKHECTSEAWLNCRQRLAAAKFMKSGDLEALAELKQLRAVREHEQACKQATHTDPSETTPPSGKEGSQTAAS